MSTSTQYHSFEEAFEPLIEKAKFELSKFKNFTNGQIIVMLSAKGKLYSFIEGEVCTMCAPDRDLAFLDKLVEEKDTQIERLICMWAGGGFDLPSYTFRKKLCQINQANLNTKMLLQGEYYLIEKTITQTF